MASTSPYLLACTGFVPAQALAPTFTEIARECQDGLVWLKAQPVLWRTGMMLGGRA
jgi:hypothetical protein